MALGIDGVRVGMWTDVQHHTGCTVVLAPEGALGAIGIRGGAPGTREAAALGATGNVRECHAVVLSGGSAFGLATADGVMAWCEANGIGYDKTVARIPIVGGAIVFDLREQGAPRPGRDAGWAACDAASDADPPMGSVGVGTGCTVGKTAGLEWGSKGGQGWAVVRAGGITVGALMAVNALGDVLDERGDVLAGARAPADRPRFPVVQPVTPAAHAEGSQPVTPAIDAEGSQRVAPATDAEGSQRVAPATHGENGEHTVIGCVVTDALLTKPEAARAADLAHDGIARAVWPAHTSYDGDVLFLLAAQRTPATVDLVAHLGAQAVAAAIRSAVRHAEGMPGFPADPRARGESTPP